MNHETESQPDFLVVLGASAGGLETLSQIVGELPADFGAPIVIGLHISPSRISHLERILAERTSLPVVSLEDDNPLEPGTIYVVPSNRNVQIRQGHAVLTRDNPGAQPSVDLLFQSAAEEYGENLIAVVLSGTGSDGSIGARFVRTHGGTVIVQNPDTAAFPGMPLSLSLSDVDLTANVDRIPALLVDFVSGGFEVPATSDHSMLRSFLEELREESGVDFTTYRQATIQRRVQRRMAANGITDLSDYLRLVRRNEDERRHLVKSFLINVTRFFRDEELFSFLREHVLPELIRDATIRGDDLRIWSAGCSTGEEAYSLAIVLHDLLEQADSTVDARIFATDLDEDAVSFARQGIFPGRALADLPGDVIERNFTPLGDEFEVRKHIRSMLVFGEHDLARRAPFPRIDLILCRNVLIYFTLPLQRRALEMFAFSLRNGGYLVLGKSETISPLGENFAPDQPALKVFRRVGVRNQVPHSHLREAAPPSPFRPSSLKDSLASSRSRTTRVPQQADPQGISDDAESILYELPCGVMVVDGDYDVQYINPEARRLFGVHATAIGQDLVHLVQRFDPLAIRRVIDQVAHSGESSSVILTSGDATVGGPQRVEFTGRSMKREGESWIMLAAIDATEREDIRGRLAAADEASARLMKANEEVLAANRQLTRTIHELRGENEQLQVTSVEIQAATEEVETLNEELQASNEELETLNEELEATIEELNTTNDDLEARSLELRTMAIAAESARNQLRGILDAVGDGVLVVDEHQTIVLHSESIRTLLGAEGGSPEFLDESGTPLVGEESPIARIAGGQSFAMTLQVPSISGEVRTYQVSGRPTAIANGQRLGVMTIRLSPDGDNSGVVTGAVEPER